MIYYGPDDRYGKGKWNRLRFYIFKRDSYICQKCGEKTNHPHCHHIIPIGTGGPTHPSNLITVCESCHKQIHNIK